MITELVYLWAKKNRILAENGLLVKTPFPNAVKIKDNFLGRGGVDVYFNRHVGSSDVMDAEEYVKDGKSVYVLAKNITEAFARDFVKVATRIDVVKYNPSESEAYRLLSDNINLIAVFNANSAGYWQIKDIKDAEKKAREKGSRATAQVYVKAYNPSFGERDNTRLAGGYLIDLAKKPEISSRLEFILGIKKFSWN